MAIQRVVGGRKKKERKKERKKGRKRCVLRMVAPSSGSYATKASNSNRGLNHIKL